MSTDWSSPLGDIVDGGTATIHSNAYSGSKCNNLLIIDFVNCPYQCNTNSFLYADSVGAWALATPIVAKLAEKPEKVTITTTNLDNALATEIETFD